METSFPLHQRVEIVGKECETLANYPCQFCDVTIDHGPALAVEVNLYPPNENRAKRFIHVSCLEQVSNIASGKVEESMMSHLQDLDEIDQVLS